MPLPPASHATPHWARLSSPPCLTAAAASRFALPGPFPPPPHSLQPRIETSPSPHGPFPHPAHRSCGLQLLRVRLNGVVIGDQGEQPRVHEHEALLFLLLVLGSYHQTLQRTRLQGCDGLGGKGNTSATVHTWRCSKNGFWRSPRCTVTMASHSSSPASANFFNTPLYRLTSSLTC